MIEKICMGIEATCNR